MIQHAFREKPAEKSVFPVFKQIFIRIFRKYDFGGTAIQEKRLPEIGCTISRSFLVAVLGSFGYTFSMFHIHIERKKGFQNEAENILRDITSFLGIGSVKALCFINRYDVENLAPNLIKKAALHVFSDPQSNMLYFDELPLTKDERGIAWEYLPSQYDQRVDSVEQCLSHF